MKKIIYFLICLAVVSMGCLISGCAYEKPYKNNNTYQIEPYDPDEQDDG